jgi:hypothetical protein
LQKFKIPKFEARLYCGIFKKINSKLILVTLIYRAGYIDDIEMFYVKDNPIEFLKIKLKESKHFAQIRYVFLIIDQLLFNLKDFNNFPKPLIIKTKKKILLKNVSKQEYETLKSRGYLKHSLNILKVILKIFNHEILS